MRNVRAEGGSNAAPFFDLPGFQSGSLAAVRAGCPYEFPPKGTASLWNLAFSREMPSLEILAQPCAGWMHAKARRFGIASFGNLAARSPESRSLNQRDYTPANLLNDVFRSA